MRTAIPMRLDRLVWSRFHTLVVGALGITWILDGLEVTLAGSLAATLKADPAMNFSETQIGLASSAYIAGSVAGALFFGWLTDRLGRKKLFFVTLFIYAIGTGLTALSWNLASFCFFRFVTGAGIGGEYAAINSAIQELIPARYRGWTDLAINGSFWIGAALGAGAAIVLLDPALFAVGQGWRLAFLLGGALALLVLFMRTWLPESPRWLITHGRPEEAEAIVSDIERSYDETSRLTGWRGPLLSLKARSHTPLREVFRTLFADYPMRSFLGLSMMVAQAFFYNAIFFTYALVLTRFFDVAAQDVGWYILPFALGNFLGPLVLGRLFDTIGRIPMIVFTYAASGVLLTGAGVLFLRELVTAQQMTWMWTVIFFFASAAASSAYLTVSEIFPLEIRALAIAVFYAVGTALGGIAAPVVFGILVQSGSRSAIFGGYLFAAALMLAAAVIVYFFGVAAERKPLEAVAKPLSAVEP